MPVLRCAFWLSIVYAAILLHPGTLTGENGGSEVTDAVRETAAGMRDARIRGAQLIALCAHQAGACSGAALAIARGDAQGLAALLGASAGQPDPAKTDKPAVVDPTGDGWAQRALPRDAPDVPAPIPDPRRHARAGMLTGTP